MRRPKRLAAYACAALAFAGLPLAATETATARVDPKSAIELDLTESLKVLATPVDPGAPVAGGAILLDLDKRPLERELRNARDSLSEKQSDRRASPDVGGCVRGSCGPGSTIGDEIGNLAGEVASIVGRLENVAVRAPEDGYLVKRFYEVGAKAKRRKPGALFAPLSGIRIDVAGESPDPSLTTGSRVRVLSTDEPTRSFEAVVASRDDSDGTLALVPTTSPFLRLDVPEGVEIRAVD